MTYEKYNNINYNKCKICENGKHQIVKNPWINKSHSIYKCFIDSYPWGETCPFISGKEILDSPKEMREYLKSYDDEKNIKEEKKKMKRTKAEFVEIDEFDGTVESIERVKGKEFDGKEPGEQYHMILRPSDKETIEAIKDSKTQRLHNYIRISEKATENSVPEGSALDLFVTELEYAVPAVKKMETHKEIMDSLVGQSFHFIKKKIGKSFKGFDAKTAFVPQRRL